MKLLGVFVLGLLVGFQQICTKPVNYNQSKNIAVEDTATEDITAEEQQVLNYLIDFGYLGENELDHQELTFDLFKEGIKRIQREAGLIETGEITKELKKLMNTPRCGLKYEQINETAMGESMQLWDKYENIDGERKIVVSWYYKLETTSLMQGDNMKPSDPMAAIYSSLNMWKEGTNLHFVRAETEQNADIILSFEPRSHKGSGGNQCFFDGPGRASAHAFFPGTGTGGDVHFDAEEQWSYWGVVNKVPLFLTTLHELGHSLGLRHVPDHTSVMYPYSLGHLTQLSEIDKTRIRELYPKSPRIHNPAPPPTTKKPTQQEPVCLNQKLVFQNSHVFVYQGYPKM